MLVAGKLRVRGYCIVKRRASWLRFNRAFRATAQGQAYEREQSARRLFVGQTYHGRGKTLAQAQMIQAHIRRQLVAFKRQQAGTETESLSASPVLAETTSGADRLRGGRADA